LALGGSVLDNWDDIQDIRRGESRGRSRLLHDNWWGRLSLLLLARFGRPVGSWLLVSGFRVTLILHRGRSSKVILASDELEAKLEGDLTKQANVLNLLDPVLRELIAESPEHILLDLLLQSLWGETLVCLVSIGIQG